MVIIEITNCFSLEELLKNDLVEEYLRLSETTSIDLDPDNMREILKQVLSSFTITKTNGIYVCTSAYYLECDICYEETSYSARDVDMDSEYADYKTYTDIENGKSIHAVRSSENGSYYKHFISQFEKENIILNPANSRRNNNAFDDVQFNFFETSLKDGQAKAKRFILSKYPKLNH